MNTENGIMYIAYTNITFQIVNAVQTDYYISYNVRSKHIFERKTNTSRSHDDIGIFI